MTPLEIRENEIRFETKRETAAKLGAKYIKNSTYKVPKTIEAIKDLMRYTRDPGLQGLYEKMERQKTKILTPKTREDIHIPGFEELRPYQRVDMAFLAQLPHAAIFNEQRTGEQI